MSAKDLILNASDVPDGYKVRQDDERLIDVGSGLATLANRVFGKRRLFGYGSAIWSEATGFPDVESAHNGWENLSDYHRGNPSYSNVRDLAQHFGDESYVHTGTMRGKPGLWALVRIRAVVHRFNTYDVQDSVSLDLLGCQLAKQQSETEPLERSPGVTQ